MNASIEEDETTHYTVREVVGACSTASALETAVEQLGLAGIHRAAISVLGLNAERPGRVDELYRSAEAIEDDPAPQHAAFASRGSRAEGKAAAIAVPLEIGGLSFHTNSIVREWGVADIPLHDVQPDPFLEDHKA